jgi:hypothetical protein
MRGEKIPGTQPLIPKGPSLATAQGQIWTMRSLQREEGLASDSSSTLGPHKGFGELGWVQFGAMLGASLVPANIMWLML